MTSQQNNDSRADEFYGREVCPYHEQHNNRINSSARQINNHFGQWTLFKWVLGIVAGVLVMFCGWQVKQIETIEQLATSLDRTVTAFISASDEYRVGLNDRMDGFQRSQNDHEQRIRDLERGD